MALFKKGEKAATAKAKKSNDIEDVKKEPKAKSKNVGDPILGLGVNFYPSEEVRVNKAITQTNIEGKVVLLVDDQITKVAVFVNGVEGIFKCKKSNDPTLNVAVDNSWD